ncbi:hypothetical protein Tco_0605511 [Tanacetum coccineum]
MPRQMTATKADKDLRGKNLRAQGRKSQDDPLVSLVQGLVTPSKTTVNTSGEEQYCGGQVSTDSIKKSIPSPDKGQRERKAPIIIEEGEVQELKKAISHKSITAENTSDDLLEDQGHHGSCSAEDILIFDEVKEEFDKLVKQVESFTPINFEATKDSLKRFGEELQTKTSKRLKSDEPKDDESTKKTGKRRKQIARKGLHTDLDKDDSEDSDEASEKDDST